MSQTGSRAVKLRQLAPRRSWPADLAHPKALIDLLDQLRTEQDLEMEKLGDR